MKMNSSILPAITLYQPWATWIMREWKTIETRTHDRFKCLNGQRVLIHAGQTTDGSELTTRNPFLTREQIIENPDEMVNGFILGMATVYNFRKLNKYDSSAALIDCGNTIRYGLFLENIHKFRIPIAVKGEMGIWYYDIEKMSKVKKAEASATPTLF